jgi:hypothetical protein
VRRFSGGGGDGGDGGVLYSDNRLGVETRHFFGCSTVRVLTAVEGGLLYLKLVGFKLVLLNNCSSKKNPNQLNNQPTN